MSTPQRRDTLAAMRHRDFQLYSLGGFFSALTSHMAGVAVGWELYNRTNSALALGLVGLVQALPVILLALPAGQVADRVSRKHIILAATLCNALAMVGLGFNSANNGALHWFYLWLLLSGTARAFEGPARSAWMFQLVPENELASAVTWNTSRWQLASMSGPALGGLLLAYWHRAAPVYWMEAGALLFNALLIVFIRGRAQQITKEKTSLGSLLAGWSFVRSHPLLSATITLDMVAVFLGGAVSLLPIFARDILHAGPSGLGWLRAAPAVGALLMSLALAAMPPLRNSGRLLLWAVSGFGVTTIVFGLSNIFVLSFAMLLFGGALDCISVVIRHTLVQVLTPDAMRGRVSAINSVFIGTSNEMGDFESGVMAKFFGPALAVILGGAGTLLSVGAIHKIWPELSRLDELESAPRVEAAEAVESV